jgi:hypothetical protein
LHGATSGCGSMLDSLRYWTYPSCKNSIFQRPTDHPMKESVFVCFKCQKNGTFLFCLDLYTYPITRFRLFRRRLKFCSHCIDSQKRHVRSRNNGPLQFGWLKNRCKKVWSLLVLLHIASKNLLRRASMYLTKSLIFELFFVLLADRVGGWSIGNVSRLGVICKFKNMIKD